jgi:hypothetical protein
MSKVEKFLMLFSEFNMIVEEKIEVQSRPKTTDSIQIDQTKSELKKVLKRLTEEYNRAKKSFRHNKLSRQELFDFEWRLFEIQEEIKKLDDEETGK